MKICNRGLNFIQIIDACGAVRICGWMKDSYIGNLLDSDLETVYHSQLANQVRQPLLKGEYVNCPTDNCPFLANGTIEKNIVEIDEIPRLPDSLYLAYEGICNYNCTCCTSYLNMEMTKKHRKEYQDNYKHIEDELLKIMPYIKTLGAHGRGELFASPHILNLLSKWRPLAPIEEIKVNLETNGSLFDEEHWKKIENLGKYNLKVAITIMSFNESVYQYLSGVNYPISKIINNLHYVRKLREQNVINKLELATVLQEQNFREMPEFTKRCIEEFGADSVRIRPIQPGGRLDRYEQWFMNVRNPEHPYYQEYKKVMSDEVFKHPKVLLWSGDLDSKKIKLSDLVESNMKELSKSLEAERMATNVLSSIMSINNFDEKFKQYLYVHNFTKCGVWGIGKIGRSFLRMIDLKESHIEKLFDQSMNGMDFNNKIIEKIDLQQIQGLDAIILTPVKGQDEMRKMIMGFKGHILSLEEIIEEIR